MRNGCLVSRTCAWVGLLIVAVSGALQAQTLGVGYRVFWPVVPTDASPTFRDFKLWTDPFSNQQHVLGVGRDYGILNPTGNRGIVYDHFGFVDSGPTEQYYTFDDLFPTLPAWVPPTHIESIFYSVNTSGRVVGVLRNPNDLSQNILFFFDLRDPTRQLYPIAPPAFASGPIGLHQRVNELGDILTRYETETAGVYGGFIFNPYDVTDPNDDEYVQLMDSDSQPLRFKENPKFNSSRDVAVVRGDGTKIVRFPVGGTPSSYEEFSNLPSPPWSPHLNAINEAAEFVCRTRVQIRRNQFEDRATKIGNSVLWTAPVGSYPHDLNESGDILIEYDNVNGNFDYLLHEGNPAVAGDEQLLKIRDMLIAGSYPAGSFENPIYDYGMRKLTDRDDTGFGWIEGSAKIGTNPDGSNIMGWFLLIPEVLVQPLVYNSADTPLAIPDNNATGVTSTIAVSEDVTIANLSVTLDISHPRTSDLTASLIGPNNVSVPLANLSGLNDVGNFDGSSSLGNWRVNVVDSVNKKTGTLNGWTLAIEE